MKYDLVIIGTGPAGLTAAIYAARYRLKILVIGKLPGGTAGTAHNVCNYPGFENITGIELAKKMLNQAKELGVEIKQEEVIDIKKGFEIKTNKGGYSAKKIIIATGSEKGMLGLEKEKEFTGKGLHYCATCDANFYKDKVVGVVGGGNAALTASLLLEKIAKKVYIIYRREKFSKAEPAWVEEVERSKRIETMFNSKVLKLVGKGKLEEVEIERDGGKEKLKLDGLFVEIGGISNVKLARLLGVKLENGFVKVDKEQRTNVEGVFAAGDVTNNVLKQIVTACGEGAVAAFVVYRELIKEKKK